MSRVQLNEEILKAIHDSEDTDKIIKDFVIELIYEEIKDPSRWTEIYKRKIDSYVDKMGRE
jgi:predicted transcriptional regulator